MSNRMGIFALVALAGLSTALAASADSYPSHTVNIVVPVAAGGGVDLSSRLLAQQLSTMFSQQFIVENKTGASGLIGSQFVADAKPDGHTLLYAASAEAIFPFLLPNLTFDVAHDLTPITQVAYTPNVIVVNPKVPATNAKELVAWIKQHPTEFRWGVGIIGGPDHLCTEEFDQVAGIKPLVVPYSGSAPALNAVLGGEVSGMQVPISTAKINSDSGKLRAIALTSAETSEFLPGISTIASAGYPGFDCGAWYGLWGPRNMPKATIAEVHQAVLKALAQPALQAKLKTNALLPTGSKEPEDFAAFFNAELKKNGALIKELNIHASQ